MSDAAIESQPTRMEKVLDSIERIGNKVPNPVLMFLYLIAFIFVLSTLLDWIGVGVTESIAVPSRPIRCTTADHSTKPPWPRSIRIRTT